MSVLDAEIPVDETTADSMHRRRRRLSLLVRRRRLSLFVIVTNEDPPNAHLAQHRPVQATGAISA